MANIDKILLKQSLLFDGGNLPVSSKIKHLDLLTRQYQNDNDLYFIRVKRGKKAEVVSFEAFFKFLSDINKTSITSFLDIDNILNADTREDNIKYSGNSKTNYVKVFDKVVLIKKKGELAILYQEKALESLSHIENFVVVENGEAFLNVDKFSTLFEEEYFVYISGYCNSLTRTFLQNKVVNFFIDYDIESMNIYQSFKCKSKKIFIPDDLECFFSDDKKNNPELYKKQRKNLKDNYPQELQEIVDLIKKYSTTVEQEIIYETYSVN